MRPRRPAPDGRRSAPRGRDLGRLAATAIAVGRCAAPTSDAPGSGDRPRRPRWRSCRCELMTLRRVEQALEVGAAALADARGEEHAELCLRLARAAVAGGRWAQAEDLVDRGGRSQQARSLVVLTDAAHGAGRSRRRPDSRRRRSPAARAGAGRGALRGSVRAGRIHRLADPPAAAGAFREAAQVASEHGLRPGGSRRSSGWAPSSCCWTTTRPAWSRRATAPWSSACWAGSARPTCCWPTQLVADGPAATRRTRRRRSSRRLLGIPVLGFVGRELLAAQAALAGDSAAMEEHCSAGRRPTCRRTTRPGPSVRADAALADHDLESARDRLELGLRPLLSHGSAAPLAEFGLWAVAARGGPRRPGPAGASWRPTRPCCGGPTGARCATPTRSWPAGATARRPRRAFAAAASVAATPWWARFLRLIALEAAVGTAGAIRFLSFGPTWPHSSRAGTWHWPDLPGTAAPGRGPDAPGPRRLRGPGRDCERTA